MNFLKNKILIYILLSGSVFAQEWKCIIYGDTRNNKPEHEEVLQSIVANTPEYKFIISVGDVVDHGDNISQWVAWNNTVTNVLGGLGQSEIPPKFMSTPGNHDATETVAGLTNWNNYLSGQLNQFGNEGKFFTFDYEDARFIILDSDMSPFDGVQYDMMMQAIQSNPKTWLFVVTHQPIFPFGWYPYQDEIHDLWGVPLYQNGCDIIFNGHDHFYLRTKKLELDGNINPPIDIEKGTVQIVTGNGGATVRDINPNKNNNGYLLETYIKDYGYTELHFQGGTLHLRHILRDGSVFDDVIYTPNPKPRVFLQAKIFLEGAYSLSSELNSNLQAIPSTSPYLEDPRSAEIPNTDIVDWVLVELRTTVDSDPIVSKSVFLHRDGRIVADNGTTGEIELSAPVGDYYVVIKHRNHLAVMSKGPVLLSGVASSLTGIKKIFEIK